VRSQNLQDESSTAHEILSYLAEYSGAQDTLDGIIEWWLLERHVKYQIARVRNVLAGLVKEGLVLEYRMHNLPTRYGINRDKAAEIRKILEKESVGPAATARFDSQPEQDS